MTRACFAALAGLAALLLPAPAGAADEAGLATSLVAMRALDARVARIGHRLAVANVELCADRQWLPGFAVHDLSQYGGDYRAVAARVFMLGDAPAVLALAEDAPAARAGLRPDDALIRIDGEPLPRATAADGGFDHTESVLDAIDRAFADGTAAIEVRRGVETLTVTVAAERGCVTRFQIVPSRRMNALADGRYVQLTTRIAEFADDDAELAAILAHEFAHNVLRHKALLDAANVSRGFLSGFGRNARLIRDTEIEADRMSVYLLDRAGFDPEAPIRFWTRFGPRGLNFLGSATHPNWQRRIVLFEREVASIRRARAAGEQPVPSFVSADPGGGARAQ
ncbi:MAG: M48 family metalloprotease [Allosphingosinicella sp.]